MSRKYCKVKTADDQPVSVAQVRQLRRNGDWCLDSRKADIGTWGRLATDADSTVTDTPLSRYLTPCVVDLKHYNRVYFGVICDGSGTATWSVTLALNGGGQIDVTLSPSSPGTAASYTGYFDPDYAEVLSASPIVTVTRLTGTGSLALRYIGIWGHHSEDHEYGPQLLQTALAADLVTALDRANYVLRKRQPVIGWFGSYVFPTSTTTGLRWFELLDKNDDDETIASTLTADLVVYESVAAAGKTWSISHTQNNAATDSEGRNNSGTDQRSSISLPVAATSYDTATPWSGGKIDLSGGDAASRPSLQAFMLSRSAGGTLFDALAPAYVAKARQQIRTVEAAGAIGINDIAETIHKCTWYQGGNVSGALSKTVGKDYTISTTKVTVFDGLVWVHNDAQSGATWGTNEYQVALRASNGSTSVTMTCGLTVDGQTGSAPLTFASGENYLTFSINLTSIDTTKYAVACKVELTNSASRTTTVYSIQISRRGAAY